MKRFQIVKTVQMAVLVVLAVLCLVLVLRDSELYHLIAQNDTIKAFFFIFWLVFAMSLIFLLYDFNSYAGLRRENLELDNAVYSDALTGVANRYSVDSYIGQFIGKDLPKDMGCATLDLVNLSEINAKRGHGGGDAAIMAFAEILKNAAAGESSFIGRNGGNKFIVFFRQCSSERLDGFARSVGELVAAHNEKDPDGALAYTYGCAFNEGQAVSTVTELVALSDRRAFPGQGENTR